MYQPKSKLFSKLNYDPKIIIEIILDINMALWYLQVYSLLTPNLRKAII